MDPPPCRLHLPPPRFPLFTAEKFLVLISIALRNPRAATRAACLCLLLGPGVKAAEADEKPLWELGAGVTALAFPDYRGSDQTRNYVFPIPYVIYRGDISKRTATASAASLRQRQRQIHASVGRPFQSTATITTRARECRPNPGGVRSGRGRRAVAGATAGMNPRRDCPCASPLLSSASRRPSAGC
jgi:outer membrane scaffolding protein for murein synthesis (MipA/OmpV family)